MAKDTVEIEVISEEAVERALKNYVPDHKAKVVGVEGKQAAAAINVCKIYNSGVREVILAAKGILSAFKPKWATVLQSFVDAMDAFCPKS